MDLRLLREEVIEAVSRALSDKHGFVPAEDSEEWEEEYRRQFAAAKQRHAADAHPIAPRPAPAGAPPVERQWPELTGTPEQKRWAATIRADRFAEMTSEPMRVWWAGAWSRAKLWIDTREVATAVLVQRLQPQYAEHRRIAAAQAQSRSAAAQAEAAAAAARSERLRAAGITAEGLMELIDASERAAPAAIKEKLAELTAGGRTLRVFETGDPGILLVKEKNAARHSDYGIERDEGLVADLKLFAQPA
ncbi:MAG: hypothetical protein JO267_10380 [Alphaproteobacteria bacterium]|nr:hypothetical protein [Alphaproteobacteria bacterium]